MINHMNLNNINNNYEINQDQINENQINLMDNNTNDLTSMNPFIHTEINKIRTNPNLSIKIEGLYKTFSDVVEKM